LSVLALVLVGALFVLGLADTSLAQPFGTSEVGGLAGWILAKQAELYRMISRTICAAKADGRAPVIVFGTLLLTGYIASERMMGI
jgi:hypothetical protein